MLGAFSTTGYPSAGALLGADGKLGHVGSGLVLFLCCGQGGVVNGADAGITLQCTEARIHGDPARGRMLSGQSQEWTFRYM